MLAGVGSGVLPSLEEAAGQFAKPIEMFKPRAEFRSVYARKFELHKALHEQVRACHDSMRDLSLEIEMLKSTKSMNKKIPD